jgi:hypothetical protein
VENTDAEAADDTPHDVDAVTSQVKSQSDALANEACKFICPF